MVAGIGISVLPSSSLDGSVNLQSWSPLNGTSARGARYTASFAGGVGGTFRVISMFEVGMLAFLERSCLKRFSCVVSRVSDACASASLAFLALFLGLLPLCKDSYVDFRILLMRERREDRGSRLWIMGRQDAMSAMPACTKDQ